LFALGAWWRIRDRPEQMGFTHVRGIAPAAPIRWTHALRAVVANPTTWPCFLVTAGIGGSYLAFAGLWAVPFLEQAYAMSRVGAAEHASALLLGVAFGSLGIGALSDRLRNRRALMRGYTLLFALSWLPWLLHAQWPFAATLAWFALMGVLIPGFTLTWTIAKEANRPEHSGIATAIVNMGIFLGAGILQPLVGWVLDRADDPLVAWRNGIALLAGAAAFGALMGWLVRSPRPHRRPSESSRPSRSSPRSTRITAPPARSPPACRVGATECQPAGARGCLRLPVPSSALRQRGPPARGRSACRPD